MKKIQETNDEIEEVKGLLTKIKPDLKKIQKEISVKSVFGGDDEDESSNKKEKKDKEKG